MSGKTKCEQHLSYLKAYGKEMKDGWRVNMLCSTCGKHPPHDNRKSCKTCLDKSNARWNNKKQQVFAAYGGAICKCCGETLQLLLTLDHINNDGAEERKRLNRKSLYGWLVLNNFPPGYVVLCFNCNIGKSLNGGICPHVDAK
jgi:hypothetical protein